MNSVSWKLVGELDIDTLTNIRAAGPVEELTVSKVHVPVEKSEGSYLFRFFNTDPQNWNLFMFPFEAKKLRKKIDSESVVSHASDPAALMGNEGAEYQEFSTGQIAPQAEIKFSKSSNLNTLYLFYYKLCMPSETDFPFDHRDVSFRGADEAAKYFEKHGSEFATNVPSVVNEVITSND